MQKVFRQILITVTRDKINDASFRQKLDPISKNILRRQNLLELVFEDISTFDAENLIVRSFLRELDLKKKQSDSDFIKSLPSQPGKEFEIKKRLDRLDKEARILEVRITILLAIIIIIITILMVEIKLVWSWW